MSSSYRFDRLGLSHWDPYAVRRGSCLELCYCDMVEWFWWNASLISTTNWFPSVLWHCWFGHLACNSHPRNDLYCVEWDIKPLDYYSVVFYEPIWVCQRRIERNIKFWDWSCSEWPVCRHFGFFLWMTLVVTLLCVEWDVEPYTLTHSTHIDQLLRLWWCKKLHGTLRRVPAPGHRWKLCLQIPVIGLHSCSPCVPPYLQQTPSELWWLSGEQGEITGLLVQYWKLSLHSVLCTHIMSSSYRSNRFAFVSLGSLHCAKMHMCFCVLLYFTACMLYYCNTVGWAWWDWGLIWWLTILLQCFNAVGWVTWPVKISSPNDLYCVEWDVKPYSTTTLR